MRPSSRSSSPARLAHRFEFTELVEGVNAAIDLALYKETLLFLATAGIVAPLFFRLRVSPVLGFCWRASRSGPPASGASRRARPGSTRWR